MSKHTPGPWKWDDRATPDPLVTALLPEVRCLGELIAGHQWVLTPAASITGAAVLSDVCVASQEDANLIVAAPDLLEAAEALDICLAPWMHAALAAAWGIATANMFREKLFDLRAAINKAEGKEVPV